MNINSSPISIVKVETDNSYVNNETTEIIVNEYEIQFDELWSTLITKENELIKKDEEIQHLYYLNQISQTKNIELINENLLLKAKQDILYNEIDTARELLLENLDNFE